MLTFVGNILLLLLILSDLILILLIMTALMMVTRIIYFCRPLFFLLQALVDIRIVGDRELVNDTVLYIFSIFRGIRNLEDSVDSHTTTIVKHFQHVHYLLFFFVVIVITSLI
jgi:hypothetical protein